MCSTLVIASLALSLCMAAIGAPKPVEGIAVRVESRSGAPRLTVDDRPVRARMFFGGPASTPIHIDPKGQAIQFEFIAEDNSLDKGTLHFRFGQLPGDVFLDDIRIVDTSTGQDISPASDFESGPESFARDWCYWPPEPANTLGKVIIEPRTGAGGTAGMHIQIRQPATGQWPDWHIYHAPNLPIIRGHNYRITLWARAEPARDLITALYRPGDTYVRLGGPPGAYESQIRMAGSAGANFVTFPIEMPWPAPGIATDWSSVDNACAQVIKANPDALLIPRLGADPPEWWRKAHPDDVMTWEDGSQQNHAVVASPVYRQDAAARVATLVEHLDKTFPRNMAGYHPCGQNTGEWFYQDTWENRLNGYAPADTAQWRIWLRARYGNDAALQSAWRDQDAHLDTAKVPTPALRRSSKGGILRDPASEKSLIDFAEFQQQAMADLVCTLAKAVRQASHGRKLVVFFYGYGFEFGPIRLGPSTCGHYALRRVLDSPDVDVLCSPISYFDRGIGGSAPAMTAAESVALAGKMWLFEDDTRTYLGSGNFPGQFDGATNLAGTKLMLQRNVAEVAVRNIATWWMDLGMTGWFDDPRLWEDMKRFEQLDQVFLKKPIPYRPEVAAVLDEHSMLETSATAWNMTEPGIYQVRRPLARMGAPYGQYLLDDVLKGRVHSKLYVFLNPWQLSESDRKTLLRQTRGTSRIWCYAPGIHDGNQTSPEAMRELTGFRLTPASSNRAWATPTALGNQLGLKAPFGVEAPITPLFCASDATAAETLATYPDGSVAVALRKTPDGWSMFVGPPGLTSDLLRIAARKAGVHLYSDVDCNVYANGPVIALHASQDGEVSIDTGSRSTFHDAMTGESLGKGPILKFRLQKGENRVLQH